MATSIAHTGALAGDKARRRRPSSYQDPKQVAQAKQTFKEEIGNTEYCPLLPRNQKPPLELNRDLMERYRPAMREHYLQEKPVFA